MKIVITGISGFLGTHLAKKLVSEHEVVGIIHTTPCSISGVTSIKLDALTSQSISPDVVVFCHAAIPSNKNENHEELIEVNVKFTQLVSELFPKAFKIYASSISVYNYNLTCITENTIPTGMNLYGKSKLLGEGLFDTNAAIVRISSMFGKGMKENTILPIFVKQALSLAKITVYGDGSRKQNYIPVEEVVQYFEKIIETKSKGIYLATGNKEISNFELAQLIAKHCDAELIFKGEDNSPSLCFNNDQSKKSLGIQKKIEVTSYLKKYIDWKQKQF